MSTVLVTGAGGFAGRHLLDLLAGQDHPVVGWAREDVDFRDARAVDEAIRRVRPQVVYHCAGAAHVGKSFESSAETLETNVMGTHHLLGALRRAGLDARVLIPSSSLIYRQSDAALSEESPIGPATPYAVSKLAQEMAALRGLSEDGQQVFIARSFNHTGPGQRPTYSAASFARQIAMIETGRVPPEMPVGNLGAARDLHDVRDTVRAYRAIVERGTPGRPYNVCAGRAFTIREVLDRLIALSSVKMTVHVDPTLFRPHDNPVVFGSRERIEREIGWTPTIPLDRTLSDVLDYWRKEVR